MSRRSSSSASSRLHDDESLASEATSVQRRRSREETPRIDLVRQSSRLNVEGNSSSSTAAAIRRSSSADATQGPHRQSCLRRAKSEEVRVRRSSSSLDKPALGTELSLLKESSEEFEKSEVAKVETAAANKGSMSRIFSRRFSLPFFTRSEQKAPDALMGNAVVIFDWDDTLLPTSYLKHVVVPGLPVTEQDGPVEPQSPFYADLYAHAQIVEEILRAASKVAHVAIVTLATRWWVDISAARYLPALDFPSLLSELDVSVYPADRNSAMVKAYALSGRCPNRVAKKAAMSKCLKKIYSGSELPWNVLSVGDSPVEREALKEFIGGAGKRGSVCKTIKVRENLKVTELGKELQSLTPLMQPMVCHRDDFDRTVATVSGNGAWSKGKLLRI